MRLISRTLLLAAVSAAAFATAAPADAVAPVCAGTAQTFVFCVTVDPGAAPGVNPTGSSYNDCIFVGAGPCKPVSVPIPTVTPGNGGDLVHLGCGGKYGTAMCAG
jgi:hypothetical protein